VSVTVGKKSKEFPPRGGYTLGIDGVIKQFENPASRQ